MFVLNPTFICVPFNRTPNTQLCELFIISQLYCVFIVTLDTNMLFVQNIKCLLLRRNPTQMTFELILTVNKDRLRGHLCWKSFFYIMYHHLINDWRFFNVM